MIKPRVTEPPNDFPKNISQIASSAAIEFDNLRLKKSEERSAIRKLVIMLREVYDYKNRSIIFGKTTLSTVTKEDDVEKALEILNKMIWEIDKATCLILSSEEYVERGDVCLAISRSTSIFSHIKVRH